MLARPRYFQLGVSNGGTDGVVELPQQLKAVLEVKSGNGWLDWTKQVNSDSSFEFLRESLPKLMLRYNSLFRNGSN